VPTVWADPRQGASRGDPRRHPIQTGALAGPASCEHVFVTAQGSVYSRLRRAIERRNTLVAWATAAELPHVELGDALALVLMALASDATRFERAAVRWHSRICREAPLTVGEAQLALSALFALGGPSRQAATDALVGIAAVHGLGGVASTLMNWDQVQP
jgi:hypothetical protein